jgi:Cdc6-like AAA superfamily ATPase
LQVHRSHHIAASATFLLQQEHDAGEIEGDVLKQADCVASSVSTLCTTYKALAGAAAAAASKGDTTMANSTDGVADHTEPMAEQQEQICFESAQDALTFRDMCETVCLPLRECEVAAVRSIVTDAIAGNRGASVLVRGLAGSGKYTALYDIAWAVQDWCKQHGKVVPALRCVHSKDCQGSAGLYGAILQQLKGDKRPQIGEVSEAAAQAKKQLEDLLFNGDVPLIVLRLHRADDLLPTYSDQLQQLFEWTTGSKLILITTARADLTQTMPGLQQLGTAPVQVVFEPFPDSDLEAILEDYLDTRVPPAALKLWAKHASGDASRALRLCELTLQWAVSTKTGVTLRLIEQAARFMAMLK